MYDRFFAGGFRSIRGFQFRGVGPHVERYNVGGDFAFLNSVEYQIPVVAERQPVPGRVRGLRHGRAGRSVLADYRVTAGVGLRISMPQLLGPVPAGHRLRVPDPQGRRATREQVFSFWIGVFGQ